MEMKPFPAVAGITLLEVTIILLLIAIIGLALLPKIISSTEIYAIIAADQVAADIRAVQHEAMFTGNPKTISFTSSTSSAYTAEGLHPEERTLPGNATADVYTITFNSFGEPQVGAGSFTITSGGNTKTVIISALTGKVTITN